MMRINFMKITQRLFLPNALLLMMSILFISKAHSQSYHVSGTNSEIYVINRDAHSDGSQWADRSMLKMRSKNDAYNMIFDGTNLEFRYTAGNNDTNYGGASFLTLSKSGSLSVLRGVSIGDDLTTGDDLFVGDELYVNRNINFKGELKGKGHVTFHAYDGIEASGSALIQARNNTLSTSVGFQFRTQPGTGTSYLNALKINPNGYLGIGTANPDGLLNVVGTKARGEVKIHLTNNAKDGYSVIRFAEDETGNGKAYIHRFNADWTSGGMWEANSIGFYESVGSMNVGGNASFKVFTGSISSERLRIDDNGNMGLGTINPQAKLHVAGDVKTGDLESDDILANKVTLNIGSFPDYVFRPGYQLLTIEEVADYINENGRLPKMPSEIEVKDAGMDVGQINVLLVEKVEELTLYTIDQQKKLDKLNAEMEALKALVQQITKK